MNHPDKCIVNNISFYIHESSLIPVLPRYRAIIFGGKVSRPVALDNFYTPSPEKRRILRGMRMFHNRSATIIVTRYFSVYGHAIELIKRYCQDVCKQPVDCRYPPSGAENRSSVEASTEVSLCDAFTSSAKILRNSWLPNEMYRYLLATPHGILMVVRRVERRALLRELSWFSDYRHRETPEFFTHTKLLSCPRNFPGHLA
ncbi:hypothetical protein NEOLEDRAFT_185325 [Neolentinus lepideus HHB14362 ss-1]|uniref:Uncharacterized protein n=1 Tax=Neolentinus lepideus HHB14362 ss-1 TaxID=1314782 RepID=A0A165TPR3_9AGAM|nr:hypothetical protein NEOLEDRAFT_185325 [Neolentinus lepideus HHB14362 ss-1]